MAKCSQLDSCHKVKMVLDKSYDDLQCYVSVLNQVCSKCSEVLNENEVV